MNSSQQTYSMYYISSLKIIPKRIRDEFTSGAIFAPVKKLSCMLIVNTLTKYSRQIENITCGEIVEYDFSRPLRHTMEVG